MRTNLFLLAAAIVALTGATAWAQTPADAVNDAVANSGVFPAGTAVVSVTVDGPSVVVDLSTEAIPSGDAESDAMVAAITAALGEFEEINAIEVTVAGQPLWQYLPEAPQGGVSAPMAAPMMAMAATSGAVSSELAGKLVVLHPSHGSYWHQGYSRWFRAMRTFCGPNASGGYQPSPYYYNTMGYQWDSFYEDDMSPETIRFLEAYCKSGGAETWVSRNLDKNAGEFDYNFYGYPNCSFPLPKWQTASKYYLQDRGDVPEWVWNPPLTAQSDKDLRARAYYANYRMEQGGYAWQDCVSFSLHSNAAGSGQARGTETYWYTAMYPHLQTSAVAYCNALENAVINAIKNEYDGFWAEAMYPVGTTRPEFPSTAGTYRGYDHDGPSKPASTSGWQDRGVKTTNFGEVRECKMPAQLMELAFHDDWKFYPDHVFMSDQIWRSTVAWGMYEGMCAYFGVPARARLGATVLSVEVPASVQQGETFTASITVQNTGQAWCWGNKFIVATKSYIPYTVWKLAGIGGFAAGSSVEIAPGDVIMPGDTKTFTVQLTAPSECGIYDLSWQMLKDDARGGAFGDVASATVTVGAAPVVTIGSPGPADYPYGWVDVAFEVGDACSTEVTATIDGMPVSNGQAVWGLGLGAHTLTVTAQNAAGSDIKSVTFNVVNSIGSSSVGGWIELAKKKGTCGMNVSYVEGDSAPSGHITYQDHDTGMTVHSVQMIALGIRGNKASFHGTCTIEGESGHWFRVDVTDNGEPGSSDTFDIYLDTGYHAGGTLGGGNVQVD